MHGFMKECTVLLIFVAVLLYYDIYELALLYQ